MLSRQDETIAEAQRSASSYQAVLHDGSLELVPVGANTTEDIALSTGVRGQVFQESSLKLYTSSVYNYSAGAGMGPRHSPDIEEASQPLSTSPSKKK